MSSVAHHLTLLLASGFSENTGAVARVLSAVAWPAAVVLVALSQRRVIGEFIRNVESLTFPGGVAAKIRSKAEEGVQQAITDDPNKAPKEPTDAQFAAAREIEKLAQRAGGIDAVRQEILGLAREYENIRVGLPSGDERTRRMELVMIKMRTLGLAGLSLLPELSASSTPGNRLAAVAILQVRPSAAYLDWLADGLSEDQPFLGYQRAVALRAAARAVDKHQREALEKALTRARSGLAPGTDRERALDEALNDVSKKETF